MGFVSFADVNLKLKALLDDLLIKHVLRKPVADVYTIEFQKRGLQHAHILLILNEEDKIRDVKFLDTIICTEIPDRNIDPDLYNVFKCGDRSTAILQTDINSQAVLRDVDQIADYLDARYVSAPEGGWRMFQFKMHHRYPVVQRLEIHLPNQQTVTFSNDTDMVTFLNNDRLQKTTLTSGTPLRAYARNRGFLIGRRSTIVTIRRKSLSTSAIRVSRARTVLCMESRSYALASKNSHIKTTTTTTTTT